MGEGMDSGSVTVDIAIQPSRFDEIVIFFPIS